MLSEAGREARLANGSCVKVNYATPPFWTEERVTQLKQLASEHSASEIGAILGCGRNAVIGKCHRMGIKLRARIVSPGHNGFCSPRPRKRGAKVRRTTYKRKPPTEFVSAANEGAPEPLNIPFTERGLLQCSWILGTETQLAGVANCCGLPAIDPGQPWCEHHARFVYRPMSRRDNHSFHAYAVGVRA
jgi:hypothetical protein